MHQRLLLDSMLHMFITSDDTCNNCILVYTLHCVKMLMSLVGSAHVCLEQDVVTSQAICKSDHPHNGCKSYKHHAPASSM